MTHEPPGPGWAHIPCTPRDPGWTLTVTGTASFGKSHVFVVFLISLITAFNAETEALPWGLAQGRTHGWRSVRVCRKRAHRWLLRVTCLPELQTRVATRGPANSRVWFLSFASLLLLQQTRRKEILSPKALWFCRTNPKTNFSVWGLLFLRTTQWAPNGPYASAETVTVYMDDTSQEYRGPLSRPWAFVLPVRCLTQSGCL